MPQAKLFLLLGAISGFLGVLAGAFGGHLLKTKLSAEMFSIFEVGVRYQMYHVFALLAVGLLLLQIPSSKLVISGMCFAFGTLLFSGSLYALALTGVKILGMITPCGGLLFLAGWLFLALSLKMN